jgi:NAD(P)-dependent dehydrogenase (short-subunit alcohol dehydrogenase family)
LVGTCTGTNRSDWRNRGRTPYPEGLYSVFVATQAALKHMKSGGRIVTIGSAVGERVLTPGLVPYAATKGP